MAGHTGHFEGKHAKVADSETRKQLEEVEKTAARLNDFGDDLNRLKRGVGKFVTPVKLNVVLQKYLQSASEKLTKAIALQNQDAAKIKMVLAKKPLEWHNMFLRKVPCEGCLVHEREPLCISCWYQGGDYVTHILSKRHVFSAYPLLVAEQLLQEAGQVQGSLKLLVPQTIIGVILEFLVPAPEPRYNKQLRKWVDPEFIVTHYTENDPPIKIALDKLLPHYHKRSNMKRRKNYQGNQELARKYRKNWYYVEPKPMKAKPWCKKGAKPCYAFTYTGGVCHSEIAQLVVKTIIFLIVTVVVLQWIL